MTYPRPGRATRTVALAGLLSSLVECGGTAVFDGEGPIDDGTTTTATSTTATITDPGITVTGTGTGAEPLSCTELNQAYSATVIDAAACVPDADPDSSPCATVVPSELFCPCSVVVSAANVEAFDRLTELQTQFRTQGCDREPIDCPDVECPPTAVPGRCVNSTCR
ncbi:MAG: hypothetical protein AAGA56_12570 [Myxococcota bacterium]